MIKTNMMDDRFFADVVVGDEVSILRSIHRAIPKWESVAVAEAEADRRPPASGPGLESEWNGQYLQDLLYTIDATKNALFAGLAVSTAATVERTMVMLCLDVGEHVGERFGWAQARQTLERRTASDLSTIAGFPSTNRARLLGNCFKHNGGRRNQEYVDALGDGAVGEEIRYEDQDWSGIIDGVDSFLRGLVSRVWP